MHVRTARQWLWLGSLSVTVGGCLGDDRSGLLGECPGIDESLLVSGGPGPDGIPALTFPRMVGPEGPGLDYLDDDVRVLGVVVDGEARAYPHPIFWRHEVVNDLLGDELVTVSFCPLTGSGLAWGSRAGGHTYEFAVSGLLFGNNLVMFDRATRELWGPQMEVTGRCGAQDGVGPALVAVTETSWGQWRTEHPSTLVVSGDTGYNRNYFVYPYGSYDQLDNDGLLFSQPGVDRTRPIKERVLGIRTGDDEGKGYPFLELAALGDPGVVNDDVGGASLAVFYRGAAGGTAVAYHRNVAGRTLTFAAENGRFVDVETGTTWSLFGRGSGGPLEGERLQPVENAYVAFWFAWRFFQPRAETFLAP